VTENEHSDGRREGWTGGSLLVVRRVAHEKNVTRRK
jgi:hypothetical protein